jgi:CDP-paratose 2-epimerase
VYPVALLREVALREAESRFEIAPHQTQPGITANGISEDFPLAGSRTLYGATKYASEVMVQEYAAQFGIKAVINRCGVLSGPWQMGRVDQGVLALWVARHHYGQSLSYIGYGGKQVRDVLHVDDLADLILLQLQRPERMTGDVFNVGGGRSVSVSLKELTALSRAATGKTAPISSVDAVRDGDVPLYLTDTSKVRAAFGWQPRRSVEQIVDDTARWIEKHENMLRPIFID